jgi:hypothetical protein
VDLQWVQLEHPAEWQKYNEIKEQIIELIKEADNLARRLRLQAVRDHTEETKEDDKNADQSADRRASLGIQ